MDVNAGTVALLALITALATGLGALPLLVARGRDRLSPASALAGGAMLAVTLALVVEGAGESALAAGCSGSLRRVNSPR
jgi:hypothetical protein